MWILVDDFFLASKVKRKSEDRLIFGLPFYFFLRNIAGKVSNFFEIIALYSYKPSKKFTIFSRIFRGYPQSYPQAVDNSLFTH